MSLFEKEAQLPYRDTSTITHRTLKKQTLSHKIIIWSLQQRQTNNSTRKSYGHAKLHITSWWHTQSQQDTHIAQPQRKPQTHRDTQRHVQPPKGKHSHTKSHTATQRHTNMATHRHTQSHRSRQVPACTLWNSTPRSGLVSARPLIIRPRTLSSAMWNLLKYGRRRARRCSSGLV